MQATGAHDALLHMQIEVIFSIAWQLFDKPLYSRSW